MTGAVMNLKEKEREVAANKLKMDGVGRWVQTSTMDEGIERMIPCTKQRYANSAFNPNEGLCQVFS